LRSDLGWSQRCTEQFLLHWSPTTLDQYNRYISKFYDFCASESIVFPCYEESNIASFLCHIADSSARPKSQLNGSLAALTCLFDATGSHNPLHDDRLRKLVDGLIKSATKAPMTKTPVMPIRPFHDMFHSWEDNDKLSIKDLRIKVICLLALVFMLRPSDIAPKAKCLNTESLASEQLVFGVDQVSFEENGNLTLKFHGIKNDYSRDGFTVSVPPASDSKVDPVCALKTYIERTQQARESVPNQPVFLSLLRPYNALSAKSISGVLASAIELAGMGGKGFSAKCFRPTGATAAVDTGLCPNKVRHIGRWASAEVFEKHYVHTTVPKEHVDKILL